VEIHRADRRYRNRALLVLVACLLGGGVGLVWLNGWLARLGSGGLMDGEEHLGLWLFTGSISLVLLLTCVGAALALLRLASRIAATERFPPDGMQTARDVPVKRGEEALRMAATIRRCAWFLVFLAAVLAAWGGWMLFELS
jgi:hypothetical protein